MRPRSLAPLVAALVLVAACSDGGSDSAPATTEAAATTAASASTAAPTTAESTTTTEAPLTLESLSGRLIIESASCNEQEVNTNNSPPGHMCLMNIDGSGIVDLSAPGADDGMPSWSPDGTLITYLSVPDGFNGRIAIVAPDGSGRHFVTKDNWYPAPPLWTTDGNILTGQEVLPASGVDLVPDDAIATIPFPVGIIDFPQFSSDGTQVSFSSSDVGVSAELECPVIMVADAGATTATQVLPDPAGGDAYGLCAYFGANWSPDGQWLLFCGEAYDSGQNLWVVHPDGTGLTQLTNAQWGGCKSSWSPDGKYIIYTADPDNDGNDSLFVRTLASFADAQVIEIPAPVGLVRASNWMDWGA